MATFKILLKTDLRVLYISGCTGALSKGERMGWLVLKSSYHKFSLEDVGRERGEEKLQLGNKISSSQSTNLSKLTLMEVTFMFIAVSVSL